MAVAYFDQFGGSALSAQIIRLCDHRAKAEKNIEIDLCTAVDLSSRDLHNVEAHWGTELGRERLLECLAMLRRCLAHCEMW